VILYSPIAVVIVPVSDCELNSVFIGDVITTLPMNPVIYWINAVSSFLNTTVILFQLQLICSFSMHIPASQFIANFLLMS